MGRGNKKSFGGLWRNVRRKKRQNEDIAMDDVEGKVLESIEHK